MLTTVSMIRCGYVYENMMINLKPTNIKLKNRMIGIVSDILKCADKEAEKQLQLNDWNIRKTVSAVNAAKE